MIKMLKISAFYLDKQKSFVPNAIKLLQFRDMHFDVSNYLYVVEPIIVGLNPGVEKSGVEMSFNTYHFSALTNKVAAN
jgi:hypothetical protein